MEFSRESATMPLMPSALMALAILLASEPASAEMENPNPVRDREKIIELVEDDLAQAYTFLVDSSHKLPHYEVLDRIFPQWHHGEPAVARQMWLTLNFAAHIVLYRIDYVFLAGQTTALVAGKRLVVWTREPGSSIAGKGLWPFQMWTNLMQHENSRCVKCTDVTYAVRFRMKLKRGESGDWTIEEERTFDFPEIPHELENSCVMKKQLKDWGFMDTCTGSGKSTLF
jgi:hypothetical protein